MIGKRRYGEGTMSDAQVGTTVHRNRLVLGRGDGAWCLCPDGLDARSVVYSFGVGVDVSFDLEIIARLGVDVHAFDPTPLAIDWLRRQQLPPKFHFHTFGIAGFDGLATF